MKVYLRLNDAKKIVPKEEAQLEVALTEKDPEGKVAGKKPRGRPKGRTSVTKATKKDKGKIDVAENETSIVTEKKPEGEADCVLKSDGKGKNREKEGDTTGKEEEYYYEPDYVAINGLWFAIQEHWKRCVGKSVQDRQTSPHLSTQGMSFCLRSDSQRTRAHDTW